MGEGEPHSPSKLAVLLRKLPNGRCWATGHRGEGVKKQVVPRVPACALQPVPMPAATRYRTHITRLCCVIVHRALRFGWSLPQMDALCTASCGDETLALALMRHLLAANPARREVTSEDAEVCLLGMSTLAVSREDGCNGGMAEGGGMRRCSQQRPGGGILSVRLTSRREHVFEADMHERERSMGYWCGP